MKSMYTTGLSLLAAGLLTGCAPKSDIVVKESLDIVRESMQGHPKSQKIGASLETITSFRRSPVTILRIGESSAEENGYFQYSSWEIKAIDFSNNGIADKVSSHGDVPPEFAFLKKPEYRRAISEKLTYLKK